MTVSPALAPHGDAPSSVRTAIAAAAERTGADFSYLVATARRESGFDAGAKAPTSSAAGLFQFVEQTWLGMIKRHGAGHGLEDAAGKIEQGANGRYRVADPLERKAILDLRYDPGIAASMAGEYTAESAGALAGRLGREPTSAELYAAHFLGAGGAARLIEAAEANPGARADTLFPAAARANRSIFTKDGAPATVGQVLAQLGSAHGGAEAGRVPVPAGALDAPRIDFAEAAQTILFQGEGPGSRARVWAAPPGGSARVLSPLVIEALAALDTPLRDRRDG